MSTTTMRSDCAACGGHLVHAFADGPEDEDQRFCINSLSLHPQPADDAGGR